MMKEEDLPRVMELSKELEIIRCKKKLLDMIVNSEDLIVIKSQMSSTSVPLHRTKLVREFLSSLQRQFDAEEETRLLELEKL